MHGLVRHALQCCHGAECRDGARCFLTKIAVLHVWGHADCMLRVCSKCKIRRALEKMGYTLTAPPPIMLADVLRNAKAHVSTCRARSCDICRSLFELVKLHKVKSARMPMAAEEGQALQDSIERAKECTSSEPGEPPAHLVCFITLDLMRRPTGSTKCVHTFDELAIKEWLSTNTSCPQCHTPMQQNDLALDARREREVQEWLQAEEERRATA